MPNTYTLIGKANLTGTATTVSFTSIPQTYKDLALVMNTRSSFSAASSRYRIYINSTSGASVYQLSALTATQSTASSESASAQSFFYSQVSPAATGDSNVYDTNEVYFSNYAGTSKYKGFVNTDSAVQSTVANISTFYGTCSWQDNSAITNLYIVMGNSANFVAGSSFYLFGIASS